MRWLSWLLTKLLLAELLVALLLLWPAGVWADGDGQQLFELHCAGCHVNGG